MPSTSSDDMSSHAFVPKWRGVLDDVNRRFAQGEFQPEQPFSTLQALAEHYGISNITARRVFRELKAQGLLVSRGRRGTFVARQEMRQPILVGLHTGNHGESASRILASQTFASFLSGFHRDPLAAHYELRPVSVDFCLRNLDAINGQILLVTGEAMLEVKGDRVLIDHERLALLRSRTTPIVFRALPGMAREVDCVGSDMHAGICNVVHHLVAQGHRRIAMITGRLSSPWFKPRFEGFFDTLAEYGLACDPKLIEITAGIDPAEDQAAVKRLLTQRQAPTAVVCATDTRAFHVLDYCQTQNIRVPDDLAVTGFDNHPEGSLSSPTLTTVDGADDQMGAAVLQLIQKRLHGIGGDRENIIVTPKLIVRDSG